ncbi:MAG: hypothetical protein J0M15_01985 [Deltaproteobacteria bacterium]|nr:hypothetical protein [Deltaproteobacteria bacterium]
MSNDLHLVIKYQFFAWNREDNSIETMQEHLKVIEQKSSVWWGRVNSIGPEKAETLKRQLAAGIKTYVFLYATAVPKSICEDGNLWHFATLKDIYIGNPRNRELIPSYYRDTELAVAFLLEDIRPLTFKAGATPKVPGQSALRYVILKGSPDPANLFVLGSNKKICDSKDKESQSNGADFKCSESTIKTSLEKDDICSSQHNSQLMDRVISLQETVIDLQQEVINLKEYKEQYQKILNADYLFSSEKFLEMWLEENIHKVADNLQIIDRQPNAIWSDGKFGRLDLLAMNKETKDLVIIEVKTRKRDKKSGYDQFLRYTTWARKNLSDLEIKYSSFGLRPTKNLSFMIVTDYVDEEMAEICREHGITLLKVFGGLGFEKVS